MGYTALEGYGLIGNLETCPLVGRDGSIDWCCFPHTESSSVFAAILDDDKGGRFVVQPTGEFTSEQEYVDRSNVLRTRFSTDSGTLAVTDFMPLSTDALSGHTRNAIYRKVTCTEGAVEVGAHFDPRFDYARARTTVESTDEGVVARGNGEQLYLWSQASFEASDSPTEQAEASHDLSEGETMWLVLQYNNRTAMEPADCERLLEETVSAWRDWAHDCEDESECPFGGEYHEEVVRSGLVLRLFMNPMTHAIAAAPTTSLPEGIGASNNWDYRYAWIRDVAFSLQGLYELGHTQEGDNAYDWCLAMCNKDDPGEIDHPLYGLHYPASGSEQTLDHLSGYRNTRPVRIGNAASDQIQLDIYGEFLLAVYTATNYGADLSEGAWDVLRAAVDHVCEVWTQKGSGIWEARGDPTHNVLSKVMCWTAVDRGLKIAEKGGFDAPRERWRHERSQIRETVMEEGYDEDIGSFTQTFDNEIVDASALFIGLTGFLPFDDPHIESSIETVQDRLATDDGLVLRYEGADENGDNPFLLCTFWLVDCLVLSGRVEEAREVFENAMEYANPLGLLSEEVDPESGELRGNYPQAFSHVGVINSVLYLNRAGSGEAVQPIGTDPAQEYHATSPQ